jgi:hypothetical protein
MKEHIVDGECDLITEKLVGKFSPSCTSTPMPGIWDWNIFTYHNQPIAGYDDP